MVERYSIREIDRYRKKIDVKEALKRDYTPPYFMHGLEIVLGLS
jgi:hypothetical protein